MKYEPIDNKLFIGNRERFAECLKPGSIAVFNSNDVMPASADGTRSFIQNTDIFYMSGIDQEESLLVIFPDAVEEKHREILFIRETNDEIAVWHGRKITREEAKTISGVGTVYWTSEFEKIFRPLVLQAERIYLNTNEHERADVAVETRDARFLKWCMAAFPLHKYERIAPVMHSLRAIKSPVEIDLIRRACGITNKTFRRLLGFIKPGIWEFEVEAEIYHEFIRNRSRGPAFESIIASGPNSCILHHVKNDRQCEDGDLLLIDFGAEYANHAADVSRTVPVNGRFTERQRHVYDAVLRIQKAAISMLSPGPSIHEIHKQVSEIVERELIGLGLLDAGEVKNQDKKKPLYKKYFMHGISHHLGLDVHDYGHKHAMIEHGMILTCEPGIYIRDEGIGVRIENDILVTNDGAVDLTVEIPVEAENIEDLMAG